MGLPFSAFSESRIDNCHFDNVGDGTTTPLTPAVEITSAKGDASNDLGLSDIRILDSWGPGIWIHQAIDDSNNSRNIQLLNINIEGSGMSVQTGAAGDLLKFGDNLSGQTYNVSEVSCRNVALINPIAG